MKKILISVLISGSLLLGLGSIAQAEEQSYWSWLFSIKRHKGVAPVENDVYAKECGDCHFAYQPGLLPEASWNKLLDAKALADHFGENAELDEQTRQQLLSILVASSAEKSRYKRSKKIMSSLPEGEAPLRITEVPYIKEKHEEVKEDVLKTGKTKKVKSLSFCNKCHQNAKQGVFDDDTVMIPEYGYWTW